MTTVRHPPELVIGTVRAIGADLDEMERALEAALSGALFAVERIRISTLLAEERAVKAQKWFRPLSKLPTKFEKYVALMNAGDFLRSATMRGDAAALLAVDVIRKDRPRATKELRKAGLRGRAVLLRSLMHPEEVRTLRKLYGARFFLVAAFSPRDVRLAKLALKLASNSGGTSETWEPYALELINRDLGVSDPSAPPAHGDTTPAQVAIDKVLAERPEGRLNVRETFALADLFVAVDDPDRTRDEIDRFIALMFGHPFFTPSADEVGMASAQLAASRSSTLSRRVGAAAMLPTGEVVAVGHNEVPKAGGGQYTADEQGPGRDHQVGFDTSDRIRREIASDFIRRLLEDGCLVPPFRSEVATSGMAQASGSDPKAGRQADGSGEEFAPERGTPATLLEGMPSAALSEAVVTCLRSKTVRKARLFEVIEYARAVHAEMGVITEAARRGLPLCGSSLFTTTFPCHDCARHIVAAGFQRVVYIEPYPKSRVSELYLDSIGVVDHGGDVGGRVRFEPFVGVAPRAFSLLFSWVPRKEEDVSKDPQEIMMGRPAAWTLSGGTIRPDILDSETLESGAINDSVRKMEEHFTRAFGSRLDELVSQLAGEQ